MTALFDSHCHVDEEKFDQDRDAVLQRMAENGVTRMAVVGSDMATSAHGVAFAAEHPGCVAVVGIHPHEAKGFREADLQHLTDWYTSGQAKAIGEIGLDYHYEDIPRDRQQAAFRAQMGLARELGLPVIVHEREAHEDGIRIVEEFPEVTGVFHCYSGSAEMAKWLIGRGWYIGFTGVLTFKNARRAVETAAVIPLERIVLETDCPYMSPEPFRGKRNDPGRLYRMAERLAEIRGLPLEEIHRITFENGKRLYRI